MTILYNDTRVNNEPWFKEWFNTSYYHKLYANRSDSEAAGFINALLWILQPAPGSTMLDVGCGNGRHCRQLGKDFFVTGIDIAPASINEARRMATGTMKFYEHDMRLPFGKTQFDYVFNFFTSFGYFKNESEHLEVLSNMAQSLKKGGCFVLDYLNIFTAEKNIISDEEKEIDNIVYTIKRWINAGYFYKQVMIKDPAEPAPLVFTEQVARFSLVDFKKMFTACGIELLSVFGNYQLQEFNKESSPRLIMIGRKL